MIEKSVEQYQANIYLDLFGGGVFSWQEWQGHNGNLCQQSTMVFRAYQCKWFYSAAVFCAVYPLEICLCTFSFYTFFIMSLKV